MKNKHVSMRLDRRSGLITMSFDDTMFHNIHFVDGFERAFDSLVDVLSGEFDVSVKKLEWVCADDDCVNCQETGTEYVVNRKGTVGEKTVVCVNCDAAGEGKIVKNKRRK